MPEVTDERKAYIRAATDDDAQYANNLYTTMEVGRLERSVRRLCAFVYELLGEEGDVSTTPEPPDDLGPLPTDEHKKLKAKVLADMAMLQHCYQIAAEHPDSRFAFTPEATYQDMKSIFADIWKLLTGDPQRKEDA